MSRALRRRTAALELWPAQRGTIAASLPITGECGDVLRRHFAMTAEEHLR